MIIANKSKIYDTQGKDTKSNDHGKRIFLFLEIFLIMFKFFRKDLLKIKYPKLYWKSYNTI